MFAAVLFATAYAATPCTPLSNPFSATCTTSIADGATCVVHCMKYYVPTVAAPATYTCTAGVLAPTRINCVPDPKFARQFPWRAEKCAVLQQDTSFAGMGTASVSAGVITLQTAAGAGEWQFKPVRTFGRRQPIEIQFEYILGTLGAGLGSNGIWLAVSAVAPAMTTAFAGAGQLIGTSVLLGIELDMDATDAWDSDATASALNADFASPHIAVLYGSEDHRISGQASLKTLVSAHAFSFPTAATHVNLVLKPVQQSDSVLVELWHGGLLVARDVITRSAGPPLVNDNIVHMIDVPRRLIVGLFGDADGTDNGVVQIQNAKFCGAELPGMWHTYQINPTGHVRTCYVVESFGNPEPTKPGVWRPSTCPSGVVQNPLAPMSNPQTM